MKDKKIKSCVVLIAGLLMITSCKPSLRKEGRTVFALGAVCSIQLFTDKPQTEVDAVLQTCIRRLEELEQHLSANADESTLISINQAAGLAAVDVPADTYPVFARAAFFAEKTKGAFNPVIGGVVKLWNIGFEQAHKPDADEIQKALQRIDYRDLQLSGSTVFLKKADMKLDLGAIAKGFAADEIARIVTRTGIEKALIDIGGTVSTVGTRPDGKDWTIGIRDPRMRQGSPIISLPMQNRSISTSGSYERYFEQDGVRYHHIIDPATGYPVRNNLVSVSIFTDSAADADALSTACFVLGYDAAMTLLEDFPNTDAIFIFDDHTIRTTAGFENQFRILDTTFRKFGTA